MIWNFPFSLPRHYEHCSSWSVHKCLGARCPTRVSLSFPITQAPPSFPNSFLDRPTPPTISSEPISYLCFFNSTNCFFRHWFNKRFVWNSPPKSLIHLRPGGEILFLSCLGGGPFQRKYTWDFIFSWQFQSGGAGGQQRQLSDHKNAKRRKLCQIYIGDKRRRSALIVNCSFPCVRGFKV